MRGGLSLKAFYETLKNLDPNITLDQAKQVYTEQKKRFVGQSIATGLSDEDKAVNYAATEGLVTEICDTLKAKIREAELLSGTSLNFMAKQTDEGVKVVAKAHSKGSVKPITFGIGKVGEETN